ncbi:Efflux RND transporter permease subunit [Sulfidibacter corallicola]|uniref:Efflux RND transporter permease subunit n=1 Tax=Sulfidibacter corallicola TaxID=2818388 RepID=A0A8A4TN83_SULCO|nr:efflux RND transporter permease subunit [Sulfidibacter corallicola]QTD50562.1 efflux RND transporter permease subunit [Sulfidibacter corallicola]
MTAPSNPGNGLIAWFANNPVAANLLMVGIIVFGITTGMGLRKEGFPPLEPKNVNITVPFISGSPKQAEEGIAIKIEESLQGLTGIKKITTTSDGNGVTVQIERELDQDLTELLNDVKTAVDSIPNLPVRAENPIISEEKWEEHAIWVQIYGDADRHTMQRLARRVREDLLRLDTVDKVKFGGWRDPEIAIEVDEARLQAYGLTLADISQAVAGESLTELSGELRDEQGTVILKADRQSYQYRDFVDLVVATRTDGSRLHLGQVAEIHDEFAESPRAWMRFQGQPSIGLQVVMGERSDVTQIVEEVDELVAEWQANPSVPEGVAISTWFDTSHHMRERLATMFDNGLTGIFLVMLVLALFLNLRVAFWAAMGLPICFAGTVMLMGQGFMDLSLNDLTTFGFIIALGIVVDDAVVVGESVYTMRQQHGDSMKSTIRGVHRVAVPTLFGVLTTVAAFYPLTLIEGQMGQIFSQFAMIVVVCLLFSIVESKLILPAHLAHVQTHGLPPARGLGALWAKIQTAVGNGLGWFRERMYLPTLGVALRYRYASVLLFSCLFVLAIGLVTTGRVRSIFFPQIAGDVITVTMTLEEDAGYGLTERHARLIEERALQLNRELVESHGLDKPVITSLQTHMVDDHTAYLVAELSDREERPLGTLAVSERWEQAIGTPEGIRSLKFSSEWEGEEDLRVEILAEDQAQLKQVGAELVAELKKFVGVENVQHNLRDSQPRIQLTLTEEGRTRGLDTAALAAQIQQAYFGYEVQRVQRGKDEVKVRVRYPADRRSDPSDLADMRVRTPDGDVVPLSVVAELNSGYDVSEIQRLDGQRAAIITADVDKGVIAPAQVVDQLTVEQFPKLRAAHPGIFIRLAGEAQEDAETTASMMKMFMLSLLLIYVLLAVPLKSYVQPVIIMAVIPFGLVGAIAGHWINGLALTLLSSFGFLALCGVVVNDSLILVAAYNEYRAEGLTLKDALRAAGTRRLRAILLTSLTTFAGLFPLLQETSEQAQYLIPVATSLSYGVMFATFITLILVPVLVHIWEDVVALAARFKPAAEPMIEPEVA